MSAEKRVFIIVEGGVVQEVFADDPELQVFLVDHDNGDCDDGIKAKNKELVDVAETLNSVNVQ